MGTARGIVASASEEEEPWFAGRSSVRPSVRKTPALAAWQRRAALCTIVSNTGCTSVGELLMTPRISLVAVCCSCQGTDLSMRRRELFPGLCQLAIASLLAGP